MNLIWFLTIGTVLSIVFGEFGHYPFGGPSTAVSLTDLLLGTTVFLLLIWQIGTKKEFIKIKHLIWLVFFWLVGLVSLIASGQFAGGLYLFRFIIYSLSMVLGFYLIRSKVTDLEKIIKVNLITGMVLGTLGFLQLLIYPNLDGLVAFGFDPHQGRLVSSFLDPNFIGAYLNICILLSIYMFQKVKLKKYLFLSGFLLAAVILTFSRSAYLMLGVELLLFGLINFRKLVVGLVLVSIILFLVFPRFNQRIIGGLTLDQSAAERIQSWNNGLIVFKKYPVLGVGFDNLRYEFDRMDLFKVFSENGGHSGAGVDSSIIFLLATTGILGLIVFSFFWINLFRDGFKRSDFNFAFFCIFLGLIIDSQFINSLFYPPIMLTIYLYSGVISEQAT